MSLLDSTAAGIVLPEAVGPLIIRPLQAQSTALQVATQVQTASPTFRLPVVDLDAAAVIVFAAEVDASAWVDFNKARLLHRHRRGFKGVIARKRLCRTAELKPWLHRRNLRRALRWNRRNRPARLRFDAMWPQPRSDFFVGQRQDFEQPIAAHQIVLGTNRNRSRRSGRRRGILTADLARPGKGYANKPALKPRSVPKPRDRQRHVLRA